MPSGGDNLEGTRRVFQPGYSFGTYWRFRVKDDFTHYAEKFKDKPLKNADKIIRRGNRAQRMICTLRRIWDLPTNCVRWPMLPHHFH